MKTALEKYQDREELSLEEYLSLRKSVPDWKTYKRLIKAEDGFDKLWRFYLLTNKRAPDLEWLSVVYYDPKQESHYEGIFKPTNMDALSGLWKQKKIPPEKSTGGIEWS